jgi:hypothetical protein
LVRLNLGIEPPVLGLRERRRQAFCLISQEFQKELIMTHLLALGSVDALEQCGDDAFLDGEFSF